jgi:hypothetical protein
MEIESSLKLATMSALNLTLSIKSQILAEFYELLQAGFGIKCLVGTSIENLFYEQLGFDPRLVEEKITTIFLNGKPVDDITTATLQEGSTLALSGAMPGLVGATLRRKSPLASFRQAISTEKDSQNRKETEGLVRIKLFNILLKELGPVFLEKGIFVHGTIFTSFLEKQTSEFWDRCKRILVDAKPIHLREFSESYRSLTDRDLVFLKVLVEK